MKTLLKSFILILAFLSSSVICQVDYSTEIQPIFNSNCTVCHGGSGGLFLSSYTGLMTGGNSGAVINSGNSAESYLWQRINNGEMPPGNNPDLSESEVNLIAQWINEGANENPLSIKFENGIHPNQVSIIQNFPNPFNPVTHFQIFSPIQQSGKISILNIAGQELIDLGVVHLNPGNQIFSWEHQTIINLPSGQYLFHLKTDELVATHKISLVK